MAKTKKPEEQETFKKRASLKIAPSLPEDCAVAMDQSEVDEARMLLANALGSSDPCFAQGLVMQLIAACKQDGKVSDCDVNFLLSIVKGVEPRDQLEAMLAAQMAVVELTLFENRKSFRQTSRFATMPR
jgi:hypothetical protein